MISNHLSLGTEVTKWFSIQPLFFLDTCLYIQLFYCTDAASKGNVLSRVENEKRLFYCLKKLLLNVLRVTTVCFLIHAEYPKK